MSLGVSLSIFKGMLNGRGEFSDRSPRYCWGGKFLTRGLGGCSVVVEDDDVDVFACPVFIISTVVNRAIVFPWFNKFPTKFGVPPMSFRARSYAFILISPSTYAPILRESIFDCPPDMYSVSTVNSIGVAITFSAAKT